MSPEQTRYRQRPQIVMRRIAGETLLIPVSGPVADMQRVFTLNRTAEAAWEALDIPCTIRELGQRLTARFDVSAETAEQDVRELIAKLREMGAVEEVLTP